MEPRLIVGYLLVLCLIAALAGIVFRFWRRKCKEFNRRWGKQKPHLRPRWMR